MYKSKTLKNTAKQVLILTWNTSEHYPSGLKNKVLDIPGGRFLGISQQVPYQYHTRSLPTGTIIDLKHYRTLPTQQALDTTLAEDYISLPSRYW